MANKSYRSTGNTKYCSVKVSTSVIPHSVYPIQLYERLEVFREVFCEELGKAIRWHLDETTLQVLNEPDRAAATRATCGAIELCLRVSEDTKEEQAL